VFFLPPPLFFPSFFYLPPSLSLSAPQVSPSWRRAPPPSFPPSLSSIFRIALPREEYDEVVVHRVPFPPPVSFLRSATS